MSSLLYGSLTKKRQVAPRSQRLGYDTYLLQEDGSLSPINPQPSPVARWQDALAALIPAEVLALHGVIMTAVASESVTGNEATVTVSTSGELQFVFWGLVALPAILYVVGAGGLRTIADLARALIPSAAFVGWAILQPTSAFDALQVDWSETLRLFVGSAAAILLAAAAAALVRPAENSGP